MVAALAAYGSGTLRWLVRARHPDNMITIEKSTPYQKPTLYRVGDNVGVPGTIRTYDLQFRKLTLYPTELQAHFAFSFI